MKHSVVYLHLLRGGLKHNLKYLAQCAFVCVLIKAVFIELSSNSISLFAAKITEERISFTSGPVGSGNMTLDVTCCSPL